MKKLSKLKKFCATTALVLALGGGLSGCDTKNTDGERSSRAWPIIGTVLTAVGLATCISVARDEHLEQKAKKQQAQADDAQNDIQK